MDLGRFGIWRHEDGLSPEYAQEIERAGFGTVWIGANPKGDLALPEAMIAATDRLIVATGIINLWTVGAAEVAESYHRIARRFPGRFVLGIGIGHPETDREYASPYQTMVDYLDVLDRAGVPPDRRVLAALGPRVLRLAAARTAGAIPYLTTPQHTLQARELIGPKPLIATEQMVVLDTDVERARALGRQRVADPYLRLTNYISNLKRLGWSDADLVPDGSDALIDALVVHGDAKNVAAGLVAHLDAGANHVCAQILADDNDYLPALRSLGEALGTL
ncbi:LLM class F420-dependent oxidoreductase [Kribbella flavida]|uniref:LLM class F420-dependent oxidoreductase n=1 Tax=Kribbella flavida TaxID=182640 RepID=UPI00019BD863|nr:LLM class F420-dependent oxidoreductase [Kribbella flavida]